MQNSFLFKQDFDPAKFTGRDRTDCMEIHMALQNGKQLTIDGTGRVFDSDGRHIADGKRR